MSEVTPEELKPPAIRKYTPQLRFTPNEHLTTELRKFFTEEGYETHLAQLGLFLYTGPLDVGLDGKKFDVQTRDRSVTPELSEIGRMIRERGRSRHPLARRLQYEPSAKGNENVSLKMDVILDKLTAGALYHAIKIRPDLSVDTHLKIRRRNLVGRDEFLEACRNLYEKVLQDDNGLGVDMVELVQNRELR